jgi:KipI family sensor histidine kinase inhibitor
MVDALDRAPDDAGRGVVARPLGERAVMIDLLPEAAPDRPPDTSAAAPTVALSAADLRDRVLAIAEAVRALAVPGVADVVPALRSVLVVLSDDGPRPDDVLDVLSRAADRAARAVGAQPDRRTGPHAGPVVVPPVVTVPVVYDGADLEDVAAWAGLTVPEVVARHAGREYVAAFVGFAPGFAYLQTVDASIAAPRLATPRTRVPAGSVALAGDLTAVYPEVSPGGWRLLGRTDVRFFDVDRNPPALVTPGARVRFVPVRSTEDVPRSRRPSPSPGGPVDTARATIRTTGPERGAAGRDAQASGAADRPGPWVEVLAPGPLALVEDLGRRGLGDVGVGRSGAADRGALRLANRLLANPDEAAAIEVTMGGLGLRFGDDRLLVLTGAPCPAWLAGVPVGDRTVLRARAGDVLRLGAPRAGLRAYVGVRGGIGVAPVLGSRSTDVLSRIGPPPLVAGVRLPLGAPPLTFPLVDGAPEPRPQPGPARTASGSCEPDDGRSAGAVLAVLTVLPGLRRSWFTEHALTVLAASTYSVHPNSDRVAVRLVGTSIPRRAGGEYASEGLVRGAVQIPPDGRPVVFLSDHPASGGYPVLGVVRDADVDLLSQLRPGSRLRFTVVMEARSGRRPDA